MKSLKQEERRIGRLWQPPPERQGGGVGVTGITFGVRIMLFVIAAIKICCGGAVLLSAANVQWLKSFKEESQSDTFANLAKPGESIGETLGVGEQPGATASDHGSEVSNGWVATPMKWEYRYCVCDPKIDIDPLGRRGQRGAMLSDVLCYNCYSAEEMRTYRSHLANSCALYPWAVWALAVPLLLLALVPQPRNSCLLCCTGNLAGFATTGSIAVNILMLVIGVDWGVFKNLCFTGHAFFKGYQVEAPLTDETYRDICTYSAQEQRAIMAVVTAGVLDLLAVATLTYVASLADHHHYRKRGKELIEKVKDLATSAKAVRAFDTRHGMLLRRQPPPSTLGNSSSAPLEGSKLQRRARAVRDFGIGLSLGVRPGRGGGCATSSERAGEREELIGREEEGRPSHLPPLGGVSPLDLDLELELELEDGLASPVGDRAAVDAYFKRLSSQKSREMQEATAAGLRRSGSSQMNEGRPRPRPLDPEPELEMASSRRQGEAPKRSRRERGWGAKGARRRQSASQASGEKASGVRSRAAAAEPEARVQPSPSGSATFSRSPAASSAAGQRKSAAFGRTGPSASGVNGGSLSVRSSPTGTEAYQGSPTHGAEASGSDLLFERPGRSVPGDDVLSQHQRDRASRRGGSEARARARPRRRVPPQEGTPDFVGYALAVAARGGASRDSDAESDREGGGAADDDDEAIWQRCLQGGLAAEDEDTGSDSESSMKEFAAATFDEELFHPPLGSRRPGVQTSRV